MSGSRKEFDVKQILKIRWKWFGHQASAPNSAIANDQGDFWNRGQNVTTGGTKFLDSGNLPLTSVGYRRSSQQDFQNSPPWPMASTSEIPTFEFAAEDCGGAGSLDRQETDDRASEEENESDSSSCSRTSNSSHTLSSCQTMEPCTSDEFFQALNHAEQTFKKMENYLRHKQLCDVVLVAGDRRIPAHRLVLSSVSDYFAAMFTNDVREARQEEIKMEGVEPNALWALVQYAYTGRLELKEDNIECLLSTACLLQLSQVVEACCKFLMKQLHPSNCLGIRSFADAQGCTDLHKVAHNYTMFLADMENNALFRDDIECQKLIMEAMKYHLLPERRPMLQSPRTKPRKSTVGVLFAVGGMDATKGATSIEKYELRTNMWTPVANMNGRRLQFGVAVLDDKLYVVGGRDGLKTLNTVECYNPRTKTWSVMPPMSTHRHGLGVAVLEGPMYAVGGHDGWSYLNTVERWDPQARQWNFVASMSTPRSTVGVAILNGKLYAVGGRDGSSCLKSVECFDPHTNKWTLCAQMSKRRGGVGVTTWNGFLYAIGGHDAPASNLTSRLSDCVERYDPKTDMWTAVASMSISRDAVGVCLLGDKLYAVGGYDGQTYLNTVESYDPQTNEWTQVAPLCLGRAGACVVTVKL
ncbi:kelch-like protein 5 isoform X3 [Falco biarmicus]|uniref:kelch-like protein 5 isoform X3 n=1 Tax=Falco rusticolus TaxID=120794 RepID=UPI0018865CA7|nr:kelch-like protein 5 isoform X3 [Falco rusticolus]XP_040443283.1 kelch-like protein 5 isoform X3 [Falco naumanni]XP_055584374.1 kelch-like protein 5 isoform X3 [Falco cherrug]XP_055653196.1 kelch-like protein 5 isoform X3 [Falco peregrinus]XP_056208225.1 kelch-like protein 5 isoform X3 [Falco biarmicus]